MATKKKAGSKKTSSQKLETFAANDPPIVVSGGGGGLNPKARGPARNIVEIGFDPEGGPGTGKFKSKTNKATQITSAQITFPGMAGVTPVTLSNYEFYTIQIKFITNPEPPRSGKSGAKASGKGKTSRKRPAASKRK